MLILFKNEIKEMLSIFLVALLCVAATVIALRTLKGERVLGDEMERYIVIIIDDYGYNGAGTDEMLGLGIPVTAAIMPGLPSSEADAKKYYDAGCDVILHQPMEPLKGKGGWLGPFALTAELSDEEAAQIVKDALQSVKFAVGINNHMGSKVMEDEKIISGVMNVVGEENLIFVDSRTTQNSVAKELARQEGIRFYERDIFLDNVKSVENTRKQLRKAAEIADKKGYAIVIGHVGNAGGETTVEGIKAELPGLLKKGYAFITISELDMRLNMGALID